MSDLQDISVTEALALILGDVAVLSTEEIPLLMTLNRVLAEPIVAGDQLPPFPNSAMDGFALRAADVCTATRENPATLEVIGEIAAGSAPDLTIVPGSAVRIMTGAPVPEGADAVVPVEDTTEPIGQVWQPPPTQVTVFRAVSAGDYVRQAGEDVQAGKMVLSAGTRIRPQEIGLMASLGVASASVVRQPRVGILATGDELVGLDDSLSKGKIRNSNSFAQAAQVIEAGGSPLLLGVARDSVSDLRERLAEGLEKGVNVFVSSAGVSVGAYDVVKHLLESEGRVRFWRVRMRPGKPLTFGDYVGVPYFGLPGNPVSAMVSFERFVRPALLKMGGHADLVRPKVAVSLSGEIDSDGRESYVRAYVHKTEEGYVATPTGLQGSHMMTSLTEANALVIVPEGKESVSHGTQLMAMMLEWPNAIF
ncbi:MAG TPA: gephyrin-like molybdotransferase Glp [Anaerolineae bacterium]|jgi:molybdopterin molybdotransferase|nr:gephyrin-like molybdotransferase Glp [Anaerolineae bacterium]